MSPIPTAASDHAQRIAFIGLGNMGGGMAANQAKAGREVAAFDLSRAALDKAVAAGCRAMDTAAATAAVAVSTARQPAAAALSSAVRERS